MNMKGIMIRLQDFTTGGHSREKVKNCSVSIRRNTTAKTVFAVDSKREDIALIIISLLYRRLQVRSELWKH